MSSILNYAQQTLINMVVKMNNDFKFVLETDIDKDVLIKTLRSFEPWGHLVEFTNGVSTDQFKKRTPFNSHPLRKISRSRHLIDFASLRGKKMLDIGCNVGYNSMHCERQFGMNVTGIDFANKNIERANFFKKVSNSNCEFLIGNAEEFSRPNNYDLVVHFGTLYHLPNPIKSIQLCFDNLRSGGNLILETQIFEKPDVDPNLCYYMHGFNNDVTNFWAVSPTVLTRVMTFIGFIEAKEIQRVPHKNSIEGMFRAQFIAKKA